MSYICSELKTTVDNQQVCVQWQEHSFLPNLTDVDRDALIEFSLEIFVMVFVYVMIRKLF